MRVDQLPTLTNLPTSGDLIPISSGEQCYTIDYTALCSALITQYAGATLGGNAQTIVDALKFESAVLSLDSGIISEAVTFDGRVWKFGRVGILYYRLVGVPPFEDAEYHTIFTLPSGYTPLFPYQMVAYAIRAGGDQMSLAPYRYRFVGNAFQINTLDIYYQSSSEFAEAIPYIIS